MFEIQDERILKYVPDYKINLIQPAKISKEEFQKFRTELGKVLEYIKLSKNKSVLHKQIQQEAEFWKLHKESFDLLNTATKLLHGMWCGTTSGFHSGNRVYVRGCRF